MIAHTPRWLLLVLAVIAVALCMGCKNHLVGLRDLSLHYAVTGTPSAPSAGPDDLEARVAMRLGAAELAADVSVARSGDLTVRVDEDFAVEVSKLLLWQGGLAIAVVDDAIDMTTLGTKTGDREAVAHAVAATTPPTGRRFGIEPLERGLARARALTWPPVAQVDTEGAVADGSRVIVPLAPETEATLTALASGGTPVTVAVVRDRTILGTFSPAALVQNHRLVIPLGDSIVAFTEAADIARLLATPRLPVLTETARASVAPDWLLAGANLFLPFAVSFAWLFFVRRFDRAQPEPIWLVVATFALGALAVIPAGLIEWGWDALSPYTNPTLLTYGRSARAFPVALLGFIVTVGVSEEGAKWLATWSLATHRREFDEPVDGIVYGAAAALGFAAAENLRYLALGRVDTALVVSRAFMSVPAHLFFGTIWGYALGRRLVHPEKRAWPLFLAAVSLHGLFDTCLSIDGAGVWAFVVGFAVASIFVVHLRLALRYGAVTSKDAPPEDRGPQELFRMGSNRVFAAFVVAVYVFSSAVFVIALFGHSGRAGLVSGVASAVALGLLGWAAYGVAETLPLDVVVDDTGVTFAGAAILYRDVVRIERRRIVGSPRRQEQMVVFGESRRLILGPASRDTIDALAHAVAMRLSGVALKASP